MVQSNSSYVQRSIYCAGIMAWNTFAVQQASTMREETLELYQTHIASP